MASANGKKVREATKVAAEAYIASKYPARRDK